MTETAAVCTKVQGVGVPGRFRPENARAVRYVEILKDGVLIAKLPAAAARSLAIEVPSSIQTGQRGEVVSVTLERDGDMAEVGTRGWSRFERLPSGAGCWTMTRIPDDLRPMFLGVINSVRRVLTRDEAEAFRVRVR